MQNNQEKKRVAVSPFRVLIIVFAGLLLGLCIYFLNASAFGSQQPAMPFGIGAGVVLSGSMEPALSVDDLIIVRRAGDYEVGDIVVYSGMGRSVVHRIVTKNGNSVVTQGDANNAPDEPVSLSDISGRVVGKVPKAGVLVGFLQSPYGVITVIGAALLLLELSFRSEKREGDRELEAIKAEIRRLQAAAEAENAGGSGKNESSEE
ncbi:MAG: signal peptidase I [Clostridia bacterium]|nr:signal peptidase I [Clostridia bacterium]